MLAYQMIYTACGKDRNGAFSLWAKSQNVTSEEWRAIESVMLYRKDNDVPDLPSQQELNTLCPKKYGYFVLPSGRKCVAQSMYIGKVYSDDDQRLGNFIIHAYIFDDMGSFRPSSIFDSSLFKTYLTESEWRADAPDDLPAVDLPEGLGNVSESEIKNFLNNNESAVAALLQATANSVSDGKLITFNASEREQAIVYTLINMLLPKNVYEQATFSTQYAPSSQMSIDNAGVELKMRNVFFNHGGSMVFNYQEEADVGEQYVFSFDEGIYSEVKTGAYVKELVNDLRTNSLPNVLAKVAEVGEIAKKANCDLDTALALYYISKKNFAWFKSADDFIKAFETAASAQLVSKTELLAQVYTDIVKPKRWGYNKTTFTLTKLVFDNSDLRVKDEIIDEFYHNMQAYGVNVNAAPKDLVSSVKNCAPFAWEDLIACILRGSQWESRINGASSLSMNYLFYDAVLTALEKGGLGEDTRKFIYNCIFGIFGKSLSAKRLDEISLYFERGRATSLGAKMEKWLMDNAGANWFHSQLSETDLEFVLKLINLLGDENEKVYRLEQVLRANISAPNFVPTYVKFAKANTALFNKVESAIKAKPEFKEFYLKKNAYVFEHDDNVTKEKLDEYFDVYYKSGRDNGLYFAKMKLYLANFKKKEKLAECLGRYQLIAKNNLDDRFADVAKIVMYLENEIYKLPFEILCGCSTSTVNLLKDINCRIVNGGGVPSGQYEKLETLLLIRGQLGGEVRRKAIASNKLFAALKETEFVSFVHEYMKDILQAYAEEKDATKKEENYAPLLQCMFAKIFTHPQVQASKVVDGLEKLGGNAFYGVMAEFMMYGYNETDALGVELKKFTDSYIADLSKGELKKFYKKIEGELKDRDEKRTAAIMEQIHGYQEEHPNGFLAILKTIFGGGKKAEKTAKTEETEETEDNADKKQKKVKKAKPEQTENADDKKNKKK
ncbi:MAG: hypothetical protein IJX87_02745 [Clostridia bacterium]|nr:hypothetical protein [Clostridia bacterium]